MNDLIYRLRKRAEIRRQIDTRKSVQEGKPDRIADLLEEAADYIDKRKWSGLTDEEKGWCGAPTLQETVARVEAELKEKNCG
jgi:hypothetical protein